MLTQTQLAWACRTNDERADTGMPLIGILTALGIEPNGAVYVAQQRALRTALIFEGWTPQELSLMAEEINPIKARLHSEMVTMLPTFASLWLDGLAAYARLQHSR